MSDIYDRMPRPYITIPGSRVEHLINMGTPTKYLGPTDGQVLVTACWHGNYSTQRKHAFRSHIRDDQRPLCKTCVKQWEWEAFQLRRKVERIDATILYAMVPHGMGYTP